MGGPFTAPNGQKLALGGPTSPPCPVEEDTDPTSWTAQDITRKSDALKIPLTQLDWDTDLTRGQSQTLQETIVQDTKKSDFFAWCTYLSMTAEVCATRIH